MSDTKHVMSTRAPQRADEAVDEGVGGGVQPTAALDETAAAAIDIAREAAEADQPGMVGEHLGAVADEPRVVTHFFATLDPAYRGWRWAVTVARASRSKTV